MQPRDTNLQSEFKPALSLTVVIHSLFAFIFSQRDLLPREILSELIGHRTPFQSQTHRRLHTRSWPGDRQLSPDAESVHLSATNQRSARCRASQSLQTHVASANFCRYPSPEARVRAGGVVAGFGPPSPEGLMPSNWLQLAVTWRPLADAAGSLGGRGSRDSCRVSIAERVSFLSTWHA